MMRSACSFCCFFLLFVLAGTSAFAQVEPDTVRQKQSLPTGPPATTAPAQRQPQPRMQQPVQVQQPQEPEVKEKVPLIDRLYWGGGLGLQFGTYTNISLMPILGYRVTDRFSVGAGAVYNYRRGYGINMQNYGGRVFAQAEVVDIGSGALLAHGEVEFISVQYLVDPFRSNEIGRKTISIPLVGIGYRQRISEKASFDLLLLYNGNGDYANPYSNPVIRGGINIPFTNN